MNSYEDPYNKEPEKVKVKVTVSVTYSKVLDVIVDEGYTRKDLIDAVENMDILPNDILQEHKNELVSSLEDNTWLTSQYDLASLREDIQRHEPWHEDELEVIEGNLNCGPHYE